MCLLWAEWLGSASNPISPLWNIPRSSWPQESAHGLQITGNSWLQQTCLRLLRWPSVRICVIGINSVKCTGVVSKRKDAVGGMHKALSVLNPDYVESISASNLSCLWMPTVKVRQQYFPEWVFFFSSTVPLLIPVWLLSGGYVPHPSSHQLYPEFPEPCCIMRKYWSYRVWCGCLSTLMGSMLLSLVGLVYGCVVFILEISH